MPPEPNPAPPSPGSTRVGTRLLREWVASWVASQAGRKKVEAYDELAAAVGHTRALVGQWITEGNRPAPRHWPVIERVCGIAPATWEAWEKLGPDEPMAPISEKRPVVRRALGSTLDELRGTVQEADLALGESGLTATHKAQLIGRKTSALVAISRLELDGALESHPDFATFRADILGAIKDAFGELCTPDRMRVLADSMRRRGKKKHLEAA